MSDIVERLRRIADAGKREDGSDIPLGEQCREAAAEITRLHARVAELEEGLRDMMAANKPFTSKPIGAPGSPARMEQDAQIAAYARARALTKGGE